jgi:hypothetical protein
MVAAIFVCDHDNIDLHVFPMLLNWCDSTSACTWVNTNYKHSMSGCHLSQLFVGVLMNKNVGVQA